MKTIQRKLRAILRLHRWNHIRRRNLRAVCRSVAEFDSRSVLRFDSAGKIVRDSGYFRVLTEQE